MLGKHRPLFALLISLSLFSIRSQAQDGKALVAEALRAVGAENLRTIEVTGSGSTAGIGQNRNPTLGWPTARLKSYTRQLDLSLPASNVQMIRVQNNRDVSQSQVISSNSPWSQEYDLWISPYGFLQGAMANPVTVRAEALDGVKYNVISFTLQSKYKLQGYLGSQNLLERVRTWVDNDVLGDMLVEAVYGDYKDFGGVKVPSTMIVKQGGFATRILIVSDAKINVPVTIPPVPPPPAPSAVTVASEKIADGVYYLRGGTHHSVLVEFADHVTLIEAPLNEARSLAILAEVQRLYPAKPLTEVVNTHHHFDHAGGLRTFVDAGAAIVTASVNQPFYEKAFAAPRTLNPDRLEQSKKKPNLVAVEDKKVLGDSSRTLELYLVKNNAHDDGMLMAFLPKEKILVEADLYTPPAANAPAPAPNAAVNPNALALVANLESLKLDFDTILPLHGPGKATRADLYAFARKPLVSISELRSAPAPGRARASRAAAAPAAASDAAMAAFINTACSGCHSLDRINNKKAGREEWAATVASMKEKGADVPDERLQAVIDYLAKVHGQN